MDEVGRLTLVEMVNEVRRRCDLVRYNLNAAGEETSLQQVDRLVSDQDIKMYLNMALQRRSVEVNINDNTIMADEAIVDIVVNQVEYELPFDLMFLRAVYIKPVGILPTLVPPNQRIMLFEMDDQNPIASPGGDCYNSYRRRLNMIVLNSVPQFNNPGGLLIDYVKLFLALREDDQVIETPLATIIQQVVIQDAAVEVVVQKMKIDATELRATQAELVAQMQEAVLNYHAPKTIRLAGSVPFVFAPGSGRPLTWNGFGNQSRIW